MVQIGRWDRASGFASALPKPVPPDQLAPGHPLAEGFASGALDLEIGLPPGDLLLGQGLSAKDIRLAVDELSVALEPNLGCVSCRPTVFEAPAGDRCRVATGNLL